MVQKDLESPLTLVSSSLRSLCFLIMIFRRHHTSILKIFSILRVNQMICLHMFFPESCIELHSLSVKFPENLIKKQKAI